MQRHTILLVEDNAATRAIAKAALEDRGHAVLEASDGAAALALMREHRPSVVVQDFVLPDTSGLELAHALRAIAGDDGVAILCCSGLVSADDEVSIAAAGFDDLVSKPVEAARLVPLVEAHLPVGRLVGARRSTGRGRRVVVCDSDPQELKLLRVRLAAHGFEVEATTQAGEVAELLRASRADALVADVLMPSKSGYDLALELRREAAFEALPIVLVTAGYVDDVDHGLARQAGAHDVVQRTPDMAQLLDALDAAMASSAVRIVPDAAERVHAHEHEQQRRALRRLERQAAVNAGLARRCSALASEVTVLSRISAAMLSHGDVDRALDEAVAAIFDAGGVAVGALYIVRPDGGLRVRSVGVSDRAALGGIEGFYGHEELLRALMARREPSFIPAPDVPEDAAEALLERSGAREILVVPLVYVDRELGALAMLSHGVDFHRGDWTAFAKGVGNQIAQMLALADALVEKAAAEREARENAAVLSALLASAPDHVLQIDRDGRIVFINRGTPQGTREELLGKPWISLVPEDQQERAHGVLGRVLERGESTTHELVSTGSDGRPLWLSNRIGPVKRDGVTIGAVIVVRDVTEARRAEAQLIMSDRLASVGMLAAGVAHEINNPLASVVANLDLARAELATLAARTAVPDDLRDELDDAAEAAARVSHIVRDLKVFSRAEEGTRAPLDVRAVLESTLRMAWNEIRHRGQLEKSYAETPYVLASDARLGQVFLNLIVNAAQALPEERTTDNVIRVATFTDDDGNAVVTVSDNGPGIPVAHRGRVFDPFFTTK
ncbi:MAG: response regulator, partial [Myxococcales bacterium]|nr:response regulator [Myxococcales bacterium]